jgi:hypothetical protein
MGTAMPEVVVENLRSAVYASHEELSAQLTADGALDSKLMGLLGFFVAAAGLLLTLLLGFHDERLLLLPLAGMAFGAFVCLAGSVWGSSTGTGPPPQRFYDDYGGRTEAAYLTQLLADLAVTADRNRRKLKRRQAALALAVGAPILFATLYGLLAAWERS